jgi:Mg/Co/Ni transporter MgtE
MKKEIGIGFLVGLICNLVGIVLTVFIIATIKKTGFESTFTMYLESNNLWMIISLGALPNLAAFFGFLKINREYRARGVLLATFLAAIITYLIYFF